MRSCSMLLLLQLTSLVAVAVASCPAMGGAAEEAASGCPFSGLGMPEQPQNRSYAEPPDPGQGTVMGCECDSSCAASIDDGYKCDWCTTKHGCGHHSLLHGNYDYCRYPDNKTFEDLSFTEKNKYWWNRITANKHRGEYPSQTVALTEDIQTSFWNFRDEMPAGRVKSIHSVGAICQFKLDVDKKSPYTGLFSPGSQQGFIRMGGATKWDKKAKGYPPGLGIKFARSGISSGSYVALVSLDAITWNFMGQNFSNHISPGASVATKVLVKKFNQASQCPSQVGLSDMARYGQDGKKVSEVRFPFKLFLVPSAEVQRSNKPKGIDDVMADLSSFPVGTKLMTAYACGKGAGAAELTPTAGGIEKACAEPFKLGEMITTTACTTSSYGDAKFFYRHQAIEADWKLRPDFLKQYDAKAACGWNKEPTPQGEPAQCGSGS